MERPHGSSDRDDADHTTLSDLAETLRFLINESDSVSPCNCEAAFLIPCDGHRERPDHTEACRWL